MSSLGNRTQKSSVCLSPANYRLSAIVCGLKLLQVRLFLFPYRISIDEYINISVHRAQGLHPLTEKYLYTPGELVSCRLKCKFSSLSWNVNKQLQPYNCISISAWHCGLQYCNVDTHIPEFCKY